MSYQTTNFYGYEVIVPSDIELPRIVRMIYDLNGTIPGPFQIKCLLSTFPAVFNDSQIRDHMVQIVIGFKPSSAHETYHRSKELDSYLNENIFNEFAIIHHSAGFYCGIEWLPEIESEPSSESESESESEADREPESDDDSMLSHSPVFPKYFS